jgi:hypothetical protein
MGAANKDWTLDLQLGVVSPGNRIWLELFCSAGAVPRRRSALVSQ